MKIPNLRIRGRSARRSGTAVRSGSNRVRIAPQKRKLLFAMLIAGVGFLLIIGKLFDVSIIKGKTWTQKAMSQWTRVTSLKAERGQILDRNGTVLASSYTTYQVCLNPQNIQESDRERIAYILSTYLEMDYDTVYAKITKTRKKYPNDPDNHERTLYSQIKLKDQVDKEVISKLNSMQLGSGVSYYSDVKRDYPESGYYAQLIGFTNIDGDGQTGVELTYNKYLAGENGYQKTDTDRDNNPVPGGEEEYVESVPGADVILTVDTGYQGILENALEEACVINNAKSVQGVLMDPRTGEILAIGTYPTFDSSNPPRSDAKTLLELSKNRIVTDTYEPGSTFKVVTLASALESGAVDMSTRFYCSGSLLVKGERIKCWKSGGHKDESLAEAVQNSCNPAFMGMALRMGVDTFYDYIFKFGFDEPTGSGVMGETSGTVTHKKYIRDADLARIGFGQSISCTGMQLMMAVDACINGGELLKPYIVSEIVDKQGNVLEKNERTVVRRVISPTTSAIIRSLLRGVVENGSGKNAQVPGYSVGGKTGTSQKYDENGNVSSSKLVASFIGFAPVDDPQFICLIIVDEPQVPQVYGSTVAAPFVQQVLAAALSYAGVAPDIESTAVAVPDVHGLTVSQAKQVLEHAGLEPIYLDAELDSTVSNQAPAANTRVVRGSTVMLYSTGYSFFSELNEDVSTVKVPNVIGLDRIDALDALKKAGLIMDYDRQNCAGEAVYQDITEEYEVPVGTVVHVTFEVKNSD
ncbi:MAG: PASTA domain-containing protein [Clostridia bacterium]|nr:PASTA domain-containing protein [Clostridia bacterium]